MMKLRNIFNGALVVGSSAFIGFMATQTYQEHNKPPVKQEQPRDAFTEVFVAAIIDPIQDAAQAQAAARDLDAEIKKLPATFNRIQRMKPEAFTKSWCEAEVKRYDRLFDLSDVVDAANPPLRDEVAVEKADRQIVKYEQLLKPCFKAN